MGRVGTGITQTSLVGSGFDYCIQFVIVGVGIAIGFSGLEFAVWSRAITIRWGVWRWRKERMRKRGEAR